MKLEDLPIMKVDRLAKTYIAVGRNVLVEYVDGCKEIYLTCEWADFSDGTITLDQAKANAEKVASLLRSTLRIPASFPLEMPKDKIKTVKLNP